MAIVNYENLPSENTPLTGGTTGNLMIMQENGTTHGTDTKLSYSQSFLNDHIVNVSNEVDEDYRVNLLKGKNLFDKANVLNAYINSGTAQLASDNNFRTVYIKVKPNTTYTIQKILSNRFIIGFSSDTNLTLPKTLNSVWQNNNATQNTITSTSTANYLFICVSKTSEDTVALENILNSLQVEEGSTATTYEPYITPSINVDGENIYSKPTVLWTNPSPTSDFANQTITLSDAIENYSYYEVIYKESKSSPTYKSCKLPVGLNMRMEVDIGFMFIRIVNSMSGTSMGITECVYYATYGSATTTQANNAVIPYQVIGYK